MRPALLTLLGSVTHEQPARFESSIEVRRGLSHRRPDPPPGAGGGRRTPERRARIGWAVCRADGRPVGPVPRLPAEGAAALRADLRRDAEACAAPGPDRRLY